MTDPRHDPGLAAFRRVLADGRDGGQAKIDALVALTQRTVHVCVWTPQGEGYRTITNSAGLAALPIFTGIDALMAAADRLGWRGPDGTVHHLEIGARQALSHVIARNHHFVLVDIGTDHELEIEQNEIRPLMTPEARRDSSGPYATVGKISSTMMKAVRPTPPPGSLRTPATPIPPPTHLEGGAADGITANATADPRALGDAITFGSGTSVTVAALTAEPSDELLDALATPLRDYPEVEWGALVSAARGPASPVPTIALRVDPSFRNRLNEIVQSLRQASQAQGASLDLLILDDAVLMRAARAEGVVFFPWRRRR